MVESEKMASLKRAYADIIVNAFKESATRVLAAERKALGFQQSILVAKEEALATMLRIKIIMGEKIGEVKKASKYQAKRIKELELQLGEAEDIIVDLREELRRMRYELRTVKVGSIRPSDEQERSDLCMLYDNSYQEASTHHLDEPGNVLTVKKDMTFFNEIIDNHYCYGNNEQLVSEKVVSVQNDCAGKADLALITSRNRVSQLYKNWCTHCSRALEHNLLTEKLPYGGANDIALASKYENLASVDDLGIPCNIVPADSVKREIQENNATESGATEQQSSSPRLQKTIFNHSNTYTDGICPDKRKNDYSLSYCNCLKAIHEDKLKKSSLTWDVTTHLDQISAKSGEILQHEKKSGSNILMKKETFIINQCSKDTCHVAARWAETEVASAAEHGIVGDKLHDSICKDSPEKDVLLSDSDNKDEAIQTLQAGTDKFLKYTFQRKRKRESSPIESKNGLLDKKTVAKNNPG